MRHVIKADKDSQKKLREFLDKNLTDIEKLKLDNIKIACSEVIQNIVKHGNYFNNDQKIIIKIQRTDKEVQVTFEDNANPCKPELFLDKIYTPGEHGSMGIILIKKLSKAFFIKPLSHGNLAVIKFAL